MAFVSGPRQVGKTTTCRALASNYLNWDSADDRRLMLRGPAAVAERLGLEQLRERNPIVVFDELHKYRKWKNYLKGFFDVFGQRLGLIVTGSSRLDITRRGSDSLMGRYFLFRMHPWSVGECARVNPSDSPSRRHRLSTRIGTPSLSMEVSRSPSLSAIRGSRVAGGRCARINSQKAICATSPTSRISGPWKR